MPSEDPVKDIIQQIRELDIESKKLHSKRVDLVHKLETAIDIERRVERNQSIDTVLFRHGERIAITNRVSQPFPEIGDRRGTVLKQKKTDRGEVKVFFRTDNGLFTHRLAKNVSRIDSDCPYEVKRRAAQEQVRATLGNPSQVVIDEAVARGYILPNEQQSNNQL